MQTIINILVFFFILGLIITIHEFGHFIAAKKFGVYCSEFSIGMGPKIFGKKIGETEYQLRLLPIGGYVAMAGEADQEDNELFQNVPLERTLKGIKTWKKVIVMLAGVFMNFVLALIILLSLYSFASFPGNQNIIGTVVKDSAADKAGLKAGDTITRIKYAGNEYKVTSFSSMTKILSTGTLKTDNATVTVQVTVVRDKQTLKKDVALKYDESQKRYLMGITAKTERLGFSQAIVRTFSTFSYYATMIFSTLALLFTKTAKTIGQLSGPAGIYSITASITESGNIVNLFNLTALLSINIGIFNLLPIPGLDGAQVLFALIERAVKREIPPRIKYVIQIIGLALVFGLMILVTINDIKRFF